MTGVNRFVGTIDRVDPSGDFGFINPINIERIDGAELGLTIRDEVFCHKNSSLGGGNGPLSLAVGLRVQFVLQPGKHPGKISAARTDIYIGNMRIR